jgi:hypothetical protein
LIKQYADLGSARLSRQWPARLQIAPEHLCSISSESNTWYSSF